MNLRNFHNYAVVLRYMRGCVCECSSGSMKCLSVNTYLVLGCMIIVLNSSQFYFGDKSL